MSPRRDHAIARLAARQRGIVSRAQLRQLGLSEDQIDRRLQGGILHPLQRGVYAHGNPSVEPRAHLLAALLTLTPEAFLSHRTAAAVHGLRPINRYAIEVTIPTSGGRSRNGLIVHRTRTTIDRAEVTTRDGLRYSSLERLLVELAPREAPAEVERLITQSIRKGIFRPDKVEDALARHAHRPGLGCLKGAVARYRPGPDRKSDLEVSFDRWLQTRPDVPQPETNVYVGVWEIDCLWREQGVALELDGRPYHVAVQDFDKDGYKDTQLQLLGLKPMRVSDFRWEYDRETVVADLLALLGIS